jgi:hypothetical protein
MSEQQDAIVKVTPVSLLTDLATSTVIKGEVVQEQRPVFRPVAPTKKQLRAMSDAQVIRLAQQHGKVFVGYLVEAHARFSNRGQPDRVIDGYVGWKDFCERGIGMHIRKAQRLLAEHLFPEHVAAAKALRRERNKEKKRRAAAADRAAEKAEQAASGADDPGEPPPVVRFLKVEKLVGRGLEIDGNHYRVTDWGVGKSSVELFFEPWDAK